MKEKLKNFWSQHGDEVLVGGCFIAAVGCSIFLGMEVQKYKGTRWFCEHLKAGDAFKTIEDATKFLNDEEIQRVINSGKDMTIAVMAYEE